MNSPRIYDQFASKDLALNIYKPIPKTIRTSARFNLSKQSMNSKLILNQDSEVDISLEKKIIDQSAKRSPNTRYTSVLANMNFTNMNLTKEDLKHVDSLESIKIPLKCLSPVSNVAGLWDKHQMVMSLNNQRNKDLLFSDLLFRKNSIKRDRYKLVNGIRRSNQTTLTSPRPNVNSPLKQ